MKKLVSLIFVGVLGISLWSCQKTIDPSQEIESYVDYVNPFIGTGGHGHTYPGATIPFGMLQVSPDNGISEWDWCSGYHYSDSISIGLSHLHLSGTGIGDLYDIRMMPVNKRVDLSLPVETRDDLPYKSAYSHDKELASPGFYQVYFKDHQVNAQVTTDLRTAYHKYEYAKGDMQSVVIDLGFAINWDRAVNTGLEITSKNTMVGYRHSTGWAKNQKVYFAIEFSKSIESYELVADGAYHEQTNKLSGAKTAVQIFFNSGLSKALKAKVSVSSVSIENAIDNMKGHKDTFDFDYIKAKAQNTWEDKLSKIKVISSEDSLKNIFYTALYHTQLAPVTFSDRNKEFRLENDSIIKAHGYTAYSTLSLWDTFRAQHPLLSITDKEMISDVVNSMLAYYDVNGVLPVWTLYGNETNTMTGYHSIPVIVEAYNKGIRNFDAIKAYDAMKKTMMQDARGLNFYKKYGYIPYDLLDESVTITLEYAYNDWCVGQMAKEMGKTEDFEYFDQRSRAYRYLFDKETGFMRGKSSDGKSWHEPFDPKYSAHRVHADYTEGNAWQHSWFVLHDAKDLINLHGGNEAFCQMLEQLFTESSEITGDNVSADISGLIGQYAHGNEPSHHIAYMFNLAGQPWRTQYWSRHIMNSQYSNQPDGLSGNEDCGQMSAWYVMSAMGLYPLNPASAEYQIGSPIFEKATIKVSESENFEIIAHQVSDKNIYIQSATLNGKEFNQTSISHSELIKGGKLEFLMGSEPNKSWGVKN